MCHFKAALSPVLIMLTFEGKKMEEDAKDGLLRQGFPTAGTTKFRDRAVKQFYRSRIIWYVTSPKLVRPNCSCLVEEKKLGTPLV